MVMTAERFFIETFGCQMNEHDSEKIAGLLTQRGMIPVTSAVEADLLILNTCSVREKAVQKVYSRLGELRIRKKARNHFIIGVLGCVAQQEREAIAQRAPFVDLVVGTHMYHTIPDLLTEIEQRRAAGSPATRVATECLTQETPLEIAALRRQNSFRAAITITEGCNKRCSFCIVPYTRGRQRNRPSSAILDEAQRAADEGYVEILLLGQTVNSYQDPTRPAMRFAPLLAEVASIPGIRRVRFTSPHPRHFDPDTIQVIQQVPTICDQIHLPVQSGSTAVLQRMRRQHDREWYLDLASRLQSSSRPVRLSTDIIVGFPGESESDFEHTLSLVEHVQFESIFSFKYSPRPHTEAFAWPDHVPDVEKQRRLAALQQLQADIQERLHRQRYLGRVFEVLVEGPARDGRQRKGRTTTNKVVNFRGDAAPGSFLNLTITDIGLNSLQGEPL